jgi:hypothetical protein
MERTEDEDVKGSTCAPWRVATDLVGDEAELNELLVICGPPESPHLICDCRSTTLPLAEQKANAQLAARAPALAQSLLAIEDEVGDLKHSETSDRIYQIISRAMRDLNIRRRDEEDD